MNLSARARVPALAIGAVLLAYAPLASSQINCSTSLFAISNAGVFAAVNVATAARTDLGTAPVNLTELEYDPATAAMWATDGGAGNQLRRLNPTSGAQLSAVALNPPGLVTGMEFVGSTLYGAYSTGTGSASVLVTVDTSTGMLTTVGNVGVSVPLSGLAYDSATSTIYAVTAGNQAIAALLRINIATGAATVVGAIGNLTKIGNIEIGPDGNLYGGIAPDGMVNPGGLYRIDKATGAPTFIGATGMSGITGLAACPAAAPPPPPAPNGGPPPVPASSPLALALLAALVALAAAAMRHRLR
jgi:hypothetical protein